MPHDASHVESLFHAALAQTDTERDAYLAAACGADAGLRGQVERLLDAHQELGEFLNGPTSTDVQVVYPVGPGEAVGSVLAGRYTLREALGEGGMGTVFLAQQTEPVQRLVAVKVIKPGLDGAQVLARFEAERQALALMDHPNIAKVLDAGATAAGHPFFVMELVRGVPITTYCDERRLGLRERLALLVPVCQAIQHAHQKGVIHRDLKPSNVLVALYDGKPVPKVIDFGVAKAAGPRLADPAPLTGFGAVIGTPEYMAPEQAEGNHLDIDTRADVYALGVLLYELLTGTTPLDRKRLGEAALLEVLRRIREEEPPRPSTRLRQEEGGRRPRDAPPARGGGWLRSVLALLPGPSSWQELDWIVMKALEKDRDRRYETATGLACDLERYLADEPVAAGPPGAGYRVRKFLRRHRGPVAAAALVLLALVLGVVGTTWGLVRAGRALAAEAEQRRQAEASRRQAEAAATAAKRAQANERAQRKQAEAVATLLESVFKQLDPLAERKGGPGLQAQLLAQLDRAAADLEQEYACEPLVRARLRNALGITQLGLGEWAKAEPLFQAALAERRPLLGEDHVFTLATLHNLALVYRADGRTAEAVRLLERVRGPLTRQLGEAHPDTLTVVSNLALAYHFAGRSADAIPLLERVCDLRASKEGEGHPTTLAAWNNLAVAYKAVGRTADAIRLYERVRGPMAATLGEGHPSTLTTLNNLAVAYRDSGRPADAIRLLEHVRDLRQQKLAADHPQTLTTLHDLAAAYWSAGRLDRSVPLFETVLARTRSRLGPDHPSTLRAQANLGVNYRDAGRLDDALPLLEGAVDWAYKRPGGFPAEFAWVPRTLVETYNRAHLFAKAEPLYRQSLANATKQFGADDLRTAVAGSQLAWNLLQQRKWVEAEPVLRDCLAVRQRKQPDAWSTFHSQSLLGGALLGQQKYADAEPLLRQGYEGMKKREAQIPSTVRPRLAEAADRLVQLSEATGNAELAAAWRQKRDEAKKPPANP
jgi:hypothetical protein